MSNQQQPENHASVGAKLLNLLASVKFAVSVVVIIALVCLVGTLIPQGTEVAAYIRHNPAAANRMEWLGRLGLTHVYYSAWFVTLLSVLAASVATCSVRRFATVRRTTGFAQRRALGSMITHISILLILTGGVIRGVWGEKGYIELREGQTLSQFQEGKGPKTLPFALHLADFKIETYDESKETEADAGNQLVVEWTEKKIKAQLSAALGVEQVFADTFRIKVLKYIPDFVVDTATKQVRSRSSAPNNPAILVEVISPAYKNNCWLFAKFPDFAMRVGESDPNQPSPLKMVYVNHGATEASAAVMGPIKSFKSTILVVENGSIAKTTTVEVNSPFRYKGYTFYQSGYNPRDLNWTSLQVVRDPGVPVVYAGFLLIIVGLFIVFYLNPWIESRRVKS